MNLNTLQAFRHGLYECLERAADGLFNTADALLSQPQAQSLAQLSLSPFFQRGWPSLYQALQDGRIATGKLEELFAIFAPTPTASESMLLGLDSSSIARPFSPTAADRTLVYVPNLPKDSTPVTPGWQFSALVVLPQVPSSWDYLLSHRRIASTQTAGQVGAEQLRELVPRLGLAGGERAIVVADRSYGNALFLRASGEVACDKLIRLAKNRVLYRPAPARTGKRGAPRPRWRALQMRCAPNAWTPRSGVARPGRERASAAGGGLGALAFETGACHRGDGDPRDALWGG